MNTAIYSLLIFIVIAMSAHANEPDRSAGLYLADPKALTLETIKKLAPEAAVSQSQQDDETIFRISWEKVSIKITKRPNWKDREIQLAGMKGWINRFPEEERSKKEVIDLVATLDSLKDLWGCSINPGYDEENKAADLLLALARKGNGLIYSFQSFYASSGKRVIGLPGDPKHLKRSKS